jgi:hypothetical protein
LFFKTEKKYDNKDMLLIKLRKFAGCRNFKAQRDEAKKLKGA